VLSATQCWSLDWWEGLSKRKKQYPVLERRELRPKRLAVGLVLAIPSICGLSSFGEMSEVAWRRRENCGIGRWWGDSGWRHGTSVLWLIPVQTAKRGRGRVALKRLRAR
jgi:hypothetical protein